MDNINETYKRFKKSVKISLFCRTNASLNKSIEIVNFKPELLQKYNIPFQNKENIFPNKLNLSNEIKIQKNPIFNKNNDSIKFPSILSKSAINQFLNKSCSEKNIFIPNTKKIDSSTQNNESFFSKFRKINNTKTNFFKNLIEYIPQKNLNDIDFVIESPYRGVEKIYSSSMSRSVSNERKKNKNIYKPVYIHKNTKMQKAKNKEIFDTSQRQDNYSMRTKYHLEINKNKEIENPLEKISKLSGMSCYKLRQVIDYSLKNYLKIISISKNQRSQTMKKIKNNNNFVLNKSRYGKFNNFYSIISLNKKNKFNKNIINENSHNINNEPSFENFISSKKRNNI
jgi:hypothetical protein